ncbi:hypothetical protein C9382_16880 [Pseudomonas aylmerensis]|uniref:Uncharacterized protein n=1 Tax=Pseudomonas aylmerensis TaxID=1869229 RepID=A0A2T4FVH7_9PSED|nr:hypothetical protein C9382_16880 [Pseudomonas aylmerensis]
MWERACSRMRQISHPLQPLTHRFREQARSHSFDRSSGLGFGGLHRHLSGRYNSVPTLKYIPQVGAGLLAKAPDQSPPAATDPPLSRASPLPQF